MSMEKFVSNENSVPTGIVSPYPNFFPIILKYFLEREEELGSNEIVDVVFF